MKKGEERSDENLMDDDLTAFDELEAPADEDTKLDVPAAAEDSVEDSPSAKQEDDDFAADLAEDEDELEPISADDELAAPESFEPAAEPEGLDALELSADVPIQLVGVMAKKTISMKELVELRMGSVLELNRPASEQIDLVANGKLIAKGELVEIDGKLGVRILKLVR